MMGGGVMLVRGKIQTNQSPTPPHACGVVHGGVGGEAGPGHDVVEGVGVLMVKGEEQERECKW